MKFSKIFLALALLTIFSNPALAEKFDPVGDLYSNDALLDLDLPADFEKENSAEESATFVFEFPPDKTEAPATAPANNFGEIVVGSGGAIEDYFSAESLTSPPTPQPSKFSGECVPRFTLGQRDAPAEIFSFFYAPHSAAALSPTGPAATFLIAFFLTLSAAWFFKHKFLNV